MLSFLHSPTLISINDHWKTIALTRWTIVGKVMSLLFNMLSRLVITFLPRSKASFNFMAAITICSDFGAPENKASRSALICHSSHRKQTRSPISQVKWSHSVVSDSVNPWTVAYLVPLSMGFSRQEYWSEFPFLSPRNVLITKRVSASTGKAAGLGLCEQSQASLV